MQNLCYPYEIKLILLHKEKEEFSLVRSSTLFSTFPSPSLLPPHFSCPVYPICFGQSFSSF